MKPKLSILIATVGERDERFQRLIGILAPQVQTYKGDVEVLVYWNNFEKSMGEIRQALVEEAKGEYVCFIDDDDSVPMYYGEKILKAIEKKPDYIGWKMQLWHNGEKMKPTFHSIKYTKWYDDEHGYYRNISHLNPIRKDVALKVGFENSKVAEDQPWATKIAPLVDTEEYIDDVMYYYYHNSNDSIWRADKVPDSDYIRPFLGQYFRYHPDSKSVFFCKGDKDSALIVVDVWDKHWHQPTQEALDSGFASYINTFCTKMRSKGSVIIHAPSSQVGNYGARQLPYDSKYANIKPPQQFFYTKAPDNYYKPWTRQHPDIDIRPTDYVSDSATAIFSLLDQLKIQRVYLVGMHLELCIIHNEFGAFNLSEWGFKPVIVKDLSLPFGSNRSEIEEMISHAGFQLVTSESILEGV